ncbi:MAG: hypothetical protein ACRDFQ_03700 [Anaerolineales bacterium]
MLISGCSAAFSAEDIELTADHLAATKVALTLTAMPTNTSLPTSTPQPSSTFTEEPTATPTETPTATVRVLTKWAPYGVPDAGVFGTARADKSTGNTPLLLENLSGERVEFIITSPQYQEYVFTNNLGIVLPQASYDYRAWIGEKGPYIGSFVLNNPDKHVLTFYPNKIHFSTP